ncbi:MAG: cytochrome P460 family protein, partial [Cyanobacteria bacterium P01_D01_bin.44]
MARPKWISGLVLFSMSVGVAIALTHLRSSDALPNLAAGYPHSSPTADTAIAQDLEYTPSLETSEASSVQFPAGYQQQFVHYATVDCPNSSIVRQMYVNRPALDTLKTSETVPSGTVIVMETHSARQGSHGRLTPTRLN